jgi:hypothetical protein
MRKDLVKNIYLLEDFFQNTTVKPTTKAKSDIDWFGLYQ